MSHARPTAMLVLLSAAAFPASIAGGAVYRCTGTEGTPHFSQFPCPRGESVVLEPLHTVRIPPVSEAEQALLDQLEREHRAERERRARARQRAARRAESRREERRDRCRSARAALADLERQRRKGYGIGEARTLDRREAELSAEERRHC